MDMLNLGRCPDDNNNNGRFIVDDNNRQMSINQNQTLEAIREWIVVRYVYPVGDTRFASFHIPEAATDGSGGGSGQTMVRSMDMTHMIPYIMGIHSFSLLGVKVDCL